MSKDGSDAGLWWRLFDQSPMSMQVFNPDGQTIHFNRAWSQLFGLTDEEGYAFNVLTDPNLERAGATPYIRRAFAGEVVFVPPIPFPVRRHEVQTRWIGGTMYPIKTPEGALREVVVIHNDITELKEAEATLRVASESLKYIGDTTFRAEKSLNDLLTVIRGQLERYTHAERRTPDFSDARPLESLGL